LEQKKIMALVGAGGMLAGMVRKRLAGDYEIIPFDLPEFDVTDRTRVLELLCRVAPDVILNCAALTHVDGCETQRDPAMRINAEGPGYLAAAAMQTGAVLIHISTDFVFSGEKKCPYTELDACVPLSVYGVSKRLGEERIAASGLKKYFIVRTSWLYGPGGNNFVETIARLAAEREELRIVCDQTGTPTYTGDLVTALAALMASDAYGLYHFSNEGSCSWYEFALAIVDQLKKHNVAGRAQHVQPIATEEYPLPARRPAYSVLSRQKITNLTGLKIPDWQTGLATYFEHRRQG